MRTKYLLAFDPGRSNGIALGYYDDKTPYRVVKAWQFGGGASALSEWITDRFDGNVFRWDGNNSATPTIIAEKFVPVAGGGFAQSLDSTYPLVCEGVLIAYGLMPEYDKVEKVWQRASQQYRQGGSTKAEKRKKSKQFLRDNGLYVYGKQLGAPDNEDAVSAILHSLTYMTTTLRHKPTFEAYYRK